jgi:hypothetical protein
MPDLQIHAVQRGRVAFAIDLCQARNLDAHCDASETNGETIEYDLKSWIQNMISAGSILEFKGIWGFSDN